MGVGTPGVGEGVGLTKGAAVGKTRVGTAVGLFDLRKADGPIKLSTKLNTIITLKTVVRILAALLLRCFFLDRRDRLTLPSYTSLLYEDIIPRPLQADNMSHQADIDPTRACHLAERTLITHPNP
jgi:hypothetical protein